MLFVQIIPAVLLVTAAAWLLGITTYLVVAGVSWLAFFMRLTVINSWRMTSPSRMLTEIGAALLLALIISMIWPTLPMILSLGGQARMDGEWIDTDVSVSRRRSERSRTR